MLSPHPADPTLTTDNLMEVVKEVEHRWEDLGRKLGLRMLMTLFVWCAGNSWDGRCGG